MTCTVCVFLGVFRGGECACRYVCSFLGRLGVFGCRNCVFWGVNVVFGKLGCVLWDRKWVFECVKVCVWMCVCVLSVLFVLFFRFLTIVDFQFCRSELFRVNLVEGALAILLRKYLSYGNNV